MALSNKFFGLRAMIFFKVLIEFIFFKLTRCSISAEADTVDHLEREVYYHSCDATEVFYDKVPRLNVLIRAEVSHTSFKLYSPCSEMLQLNYLIKMSYVSAVFINHFRREQ